jgi:hypothetical protein
MNRNEFVEKELNVLLNLIELYNQIPNEFTKYQIDFFAHHWCDFHGDRQFNKGYDGYLKKHLKELVNTA